MKYYVENQAGIQFVVSAETSVEAIMKIWVLQIRNVPRTTPPAIETEYAVHLGQREHAVLVSSAAAWWRLPHEYRQLIHDWIRDTAHPDDYEQFFNNLVDIERNR
ncbi:hypothetical protein [Novipirellula artificiosorum]|uniref:Uncharacterized protein n=1 Tax=Novipirellula artificiosorum TaxID=2528016 RepID=A0A5C6DIV0_9BACT|nr:hypothetical protein [Novipirellula artificiosorum]TWU36024.1 hypothetical protein Poly41_37770 [Novipirellula artificiosorum]